MPRYIIGLFLISILFFPQVSLAFDFYSLSLQSWETIKEFIAAPFVSKEKGETPSLSLQDIGKIQKSLQENQSQLNLTKQELQDLKNQFVSFTQQPVTIREIKQEIQKIIQPEKVVRVEKLIEKEIIASNTLLDLQAQLSSMGIRLTATENRLALTPAPQIIYTTTTAAPVVVSSFGSLNVDKLYVPTEATIKKLTLTGDASISGNLSVSGTQTFTGAPTFSSLTAGSIPFAGTGGLLSQDNANLFWDNTNKGLGIGTTNIDRPLVIQGVSGASAVIRFTDTTNPKSWHIGTLSDNDFTITETSVADRIIVKAGGNVGIGTTEPTSILHIAGTLSNDFGVDINSTVNIQGAFGSALRVRGTVNPGVGDDAYLTTITGGTITKAGSGTHAILAAVSIDAPTITAGSASVTKTAALRIGGASSAGTSNFGLMIDSDTTQSGFGAGSASAPGITFTNEVGNNSGLYSDAADTIRISTGGTHRLTIDSSGNVGIGTTGPQSKLDTFESTGAGGTSYVRFHNQPTDNQGAVRLYFQIAGNVGTVLGGGSSAYIEANRASAGTEIAHLAFATDDGASTGERVRITGTGNVGINQTNPTAMTTTGATLEVVGGICVKNATACPTGLTAGAIRFDTDSVVFDIAETYSSLEPLSPGDLVMVDKENPLHVKKAVSNSDALIGVVSTHPAIAIKDSEVILGPNPSEENSLQPLITLAGRVPVKVSLENGEIKIGDRLTSSSQPGVAMRATQSGQTIGIALEPLTQEILNSKSEILNSKIMVFINLGYHVSAEALPAAVDSTPFYANLLTYLKDALSQLTGKITAMEEGISLKDKVSGDYYCVQIENGEIIKTKGKCGEQIIPESPPVQEETSPIPEETPAP